MRNALAVVGAVDIHLAAAIGTIEQAREGSCFAPAVRVASDIPTDFLHKVKYVYDHFTGNAPVLLGKLNVGIIKGGEAYSFEYNKD